MKRTGGTNFATLAIGAGNPSAIQPGDVVQYGASHRALVAELGHGGVRAWPIVPQTTPRHRGDLRLSAEHVATLGLPSSHAWLIRCTTTEMVAPVAILGRVCEALTQDVQRTAHRAAIADAMELKPIAPTRRRTPTPRRLWGEWID